MAAVLKPSSSHPILHHFLRPPPPPTPTSSLFLFKPLSSIPLHPPPHRTYSSTSLSSRPLLFTSSALSLSSYPRPLHPPPRSLSTSQPTLQLEIEDQSDEDEDEDEDEDFESENEEADGHVAAEEGDSNSSPSTRAKELATELPSLTVKEKKELASYAHSLGKKLKSQQVGKSGVTDSVATALVETLEKNEILKLKIHNSCPGELDDVVVHLQKATGSVVVGQIGRTVILYRPSLTKLKAKEKMEQARKVFRRKQRTFKLPYEDKGQLPRPSGRGRRGSGRFSSSP